MTDDARRNGIHIDLIEATRDEESVLANLLELYAHDFSEFHNVPLGEDGRFRYKNLPLYWSEQGRHAFLVRISGQLAGFVLVKQGSEVSGEAEIWDLAEFFILRGYRRRGVGCAVAHELWRRLRGRWEVRVMESNRTAIEFWDRAISRLNGGPIGATRFERDGLNWRVFSFESKAL